jgi:glucosamine--fructose-6-phosphate aminotransferase (isomerizing)
MCGIVGIIQKNVLTHLIEGIKQLQNRGYDSAGISYYENKEATFKTHKFASTKENTAIEKLTSSLNENQEKIYCGIGHTRWATHGGKTDENSHPHFSFDNKIVLVHNGIIENYRPLKEICEKNNLTFKSETDSEVIVNLIAYTYQEQIEKNLVEAIKMVCKQLEGTWALVIMCIDYPEQLFCTRHGSPLLIGKQNNCAYVVSEQSAFHNQVKDYFVLENDDICSLSYLKESNKIQINTNEIYQTKQLSYTQTKFTSEPYDYFMEKEIIEQTDSSLRAISLGGRVLSNDCVKLGGLEMHEKELLCLDHIILLGCGTSYHAGLLGVEYFKELTDFHTVQLFDGAEFDLKDVPKSGCTGLVLLSQSGETKDLHRCIQIGKNNNLFLIGIVNVVDSLIAREVDCGVYLNAGREIGVASTKSFTSQVIILSLMAIWFAQKRNINLNKRRNYIKDLRNLHVNIEKVINKYHNNMEKSLEYFNNFSSCFLLGKGRAYSIALEGALKIKEISYLHAEGYCASSLKHGPLALIEKDFPIILIHTHRNDENKIKNVYQELKSREAKIIYITYEKEVTFLESEDLLLSTGCNYENNFTDLLSIIPIQFLCYYLALKKKYNPDMPRNLAKVVTVE